MILFITSIVVCIVSPIQAVCPTRKGKEIDGSCYTQYNGLNKHDAMKKCQKIPNSVVYDPPKYDDMVKVLDKFPEKSV